MNSCSISEIASAFGALKPWEEEAIKKNGSMKLDMPTAKSVSVLTESNPLSNGDESILTTDLLSDSICLRAALLLACIDLAGSDSADAEVLAEQYYGSAQELLKKLDSQGINILATVRSISSCSLSTYPKKGS